MRCKSEETMEQIKNAVEEFYFSHYRSHSIGELAAEVGYAKMALLGLRLGKFWGPVVCAVITGLFAVSGLYIGGQIAQAIWDCIWQGKRGIEFTVKRNRWGHPYAINIYAR